MKPQKFILAMTVLSLFSACTTRSMFEEEVQKRFQEKEAESRVIKTEDLQSLPKPIANYLEYCGWVGKQIPRNFYLKFKGDFSLKEGKFTPVVSEQYNWLNEKPCRLFQIRNRMFGGLHRYDERGAIMIIKLLDCFKIVDARGEIMDQSELVTYLNDMCILAPGALIEAPITWETIDDFHVKASISQFGHTVSAEITFNDKYELVDFISYDRFASPDGKKKVLLPWSTPMHNYREMNGILVPSYGEAIWHHSDRKQVYAKLLVEEIRWNVNK